MIKKYGISEEESEIMDRAKAREIIQVILEYGISQPQILHMIYLLALELENNDHMKKITDIIKELKEEKTDTSSIILKGD